MSGFSQPGRYVNKFRAAFDSDCEECGGEIYEGEIAGYLPGDEEASCQECVEGYES